MDSVTSLGPFESPDRSAHDAPRHADPPRPASAHGEPPTPAAEWRPFWVRFFDTFFQEQNIQWILGVGMLILLGSSLMLVTSHWDTYTPLWKHLILIGYTAAIHAAGQAAYRWLGLRKTGTGLMALTVLLIPLTFLALRWVHGAEPLTLGGVARHAGLLALMAANTLFAVFAALRIFRHFLRRTQPTFLISYVLLSVAGAVIPSLPAAAIPVSTLALWLVFAAGAIKVNRHVFWLTEENRLPRIVGFFPILLLGGQFLTLFVAGLAEHMPLEWIGLGCVLTAIPVLLTADSLARVHQELHGDLARPLPWAIVLPMFVGCAFTLAGVCLAGLRFPQSPVLVPAAALGAIVMGLVARRTQQAAFVWAMLVGVLMAYQCSPAFFREFAASVVRQGAAAVQESRLPIAFYGLTYLPLLLVTTLIATRGQRRGESLFAPVIRKFSTALPLLLLAVSVSHLKAMLPVGLALTALFSLQAVLFRERSLIVVSIAAWIAAAQGFTPFVEQVLSVGRTAELPVLAWTIAAAVLLLPGSWIDRRTQRWLSAEERPHAMPFCQLASLLATVCTAGAWLVQSLSPAVGLSVAPVSGVLLSVLLLLHAARWGKVGLSDASLAYVVLVAMRLASAADWPLLNVFTLGTGLLAALWLGSEWLRKWSGPFGRLFAEAGERVSSMGILLATVGLLIPYWHATIVFAVPFPIWTIALIATAWLLDAGRRLQMGWLTAAGWFALLATIGSGALLLPGITQEWLPAVWMATTMPGIPVAVMVLRRSAVPECSATDPAAFGTSGVAAIAFRRSLAATLALAAVGSLFVFNTPMRTAGALALAGLLLVSFLWRQSMTRLIALILVDWQVLCGVLQAFAPGIADLEGLKYVEFLPAAFPIAFAAVLQAFFWQRRLSRNEMLPEVVTIERLALLAVCGASLLCALPQSNVGIANWQIGLVIGTFVLLMADRIGTALRSGEVHVWAAEGVCVAGLAYLWMFGVIELGHGISQFAVLGSAFVAWGLSRWFARLSGYTVLARPLWITAHCLPAVTVLIGVAHHVLQPQPVWLGLNSLALLLAAGFYFWQGLERKESGFVIGAAAILNVALAMLWRELSWSDPQLFLIPPGISILALVEFLREEIPERALNPLRYAGALVILVSPTFHIVGGSWLHLFSLMVVSVGITLVSMGLRIRALMYTGTAFLVADLVAMVVRGSIDEPSLLWITGIALGLLIIALAAYCERHREQILQRMRLVAAELETWR